MAIEAGVVDRVRRYWDRRALSFQADIAATPDRSGWRSAYARALRELFPQREKPLRILDVGTGTGFVAILCAELGHEVTGVEIAPTMLELAAKEAAEYGVRVELIEGAADPLPETGERFDVVTCRNLLWTLPDPLRALKGWREALRPGGAVLVSDGMWNTPRQEWRLLRDGWRSRGDEPVGWRFLTSYLTIRHRLPHYRGLDRATARGLLTDAGYSAVRSFDELLAEDCYEEGTGDGFFLAGAYR